MPVKAAAMKKPAKAAAAGKKKQESFSDDATDSNCEGNAGGSATVEAKLRQIHPVIPRACEGMPVKALEDKKDENVLTYLIVFDVVPAKACLAHVVYEFIACKGIACEGFRLRRHCCIR